MIEKKPNLTSVPIEKETLDDRVVESTRLVKLSTLTYWSIFCMMSDVNPCPSSDK